MLLFVKSNQINKWKYKKNIHIFLHNYILITLYKNKGDRGQCGNSRGIALLSTAGKVFAKILLNRLVSSVSEDILPESQCGFRSNRSTADMIFAARQLLEKSREQRRDLYMAFIDLSKAFDSVDRDLLWKVLHKCGCPTRFVELIRCLHDGMSLKIRIGGELSEPFVVSRGVKQGCVLAPVLFNTYVHCTVHHPSPREGTRQKLSSRPELQNRS